MRLPAVTPVFATYWRFAAERQHVFFRRLAGQPSPWTDDPILNAYRFTNAYRASDRVSQYLIRHVLYAGEQDHTEIFFRALMFKLFNRIHTWELLVNKLGAIRWADYDFDRYDAVLSSALSRGERLFSAAYMMPGGARQFGGARKHQNYLRLLEHMMADDAPARLADAPTMQAAYHLLRGYPLLGDFLAFQFTIDLNYSTLTNFSEMEFVVAGPGAREGIRKCFADPGRCSETDLIRWMADHQAEQFALQSAAHGLHFETLWDRPLQLIDCQNLFCEVAKYARVAHPDHTPPGGRARIKQRYAPTQPHDPLAPPWYPPKWGINAAISNHH